MVALIREDLRDRQHRTIAFEAFAYMFCTIFEMIRVNFKYSI